MNVDQLSIDPAAPPRPRARRWHATPTPGQQAGANPRGSWLYWRDAAGFEWNTYRLAIANLPAELEGFRIVHLADLHCRRRWQSAYDQLGQRLAADEPDLILFTGDAVEKKHNPGPALPTARRLMGLLRSRLGVFGIHGNHDIEVTAADFAGTPLHMVDGRRIIVNQPHAPVEILAVPGPERENLTHQWQDALPPKIGSVPRIILSHFPDHIRALRWLEPDIYLAGHTHGGQMCLPGGFPILRHDSLPPRLCAGVHRYADTWFIVNRGLGFSSLQIRTFCPPEVIELVLSAADDVADSAKPPALQTTPIHR